MPLKYYIVIALLNDKTKIPGCILRQEAEVLVARQAGSGVPALWKVAGALRAPEKVSWLDISWKSSPLTPLLTIIKFQSQSWVYFFGAAISHKDFPVFHSLWHTRICLLSLWAWKYFSREGASQVNFSKRGGIFLEDNLLVLQGKCGL